MEEKIPHNTYIKWEEHKEKLKESGENITIDAFLEFYNKQINMEENAQYLRRPNRTDGRVPRSQEKAFVLQTKVSQDKKPFQKTRPQTSGSVQKKNKVRGSKGSNKWNKPGQKGGPSNTPTEGVPTQRYCIFCESLTHPTGFCKAGKHTAEFKRAQCNKHNACYMCFQTTEHKALTCPKTMKCYICSKTHHFNNHSRAEINEYYKKQKANKKQ